MRGEPEILANLLARLDLRGHQAGDIEDDFLVVDGGNTIGRWSYLDRHGALMIGHRLHPRALGQREEGKRHQ
ncbi:hypothetical protein ACFSHP_20230 [Novosphingobium panipatense]